MELHHRTESVKLILRRPLVWRGDGTKTIDLKRDPDKNYRILQKSMAKLFKNYPPQAGK